MYRIPHRYFYNFEEAGAILGLSVEEVEKLTTHADLNCILLAGRHKRILHKDLQSFIQKKNGKIPASWSEPQEQLRVLIVEDDEDLLEIVTDLLHDEIQLSIRAESNAFNAGLQIGGWKPDLVLLDFLMPGITGFELCRQLRSNEKTTDLPVLAMTSLTDDKNRADIMASGVTDFIGKPFHSEALLAKVRELLALDLALDASS